MVEKREMTGDLYGLRGWFRGGSCVDHIVRGTRFSIEENAKGETCIFAYGREYPTDASILYDARTKSVAVG